MRLPPLRTPLRHRLAALRPLCPNCRRLSSAAPAAAPPLPPPPAGFASLSSRRLIAVSGSDAARFLQGIVTSNVTRADGLPRTDGFYTAFLNATGRVLHDVLVYPFISGSVVPVEGDGFLLEVDAGQVSNLTRYIKRYQLRAKVAIRAITPDEATVWHAWDDASELDLPPQASSLLPRDTRAPRFGARILQFKSGPPELNLPLSHEDAYRIRRYLRGVPEGQAEILREQALPQESNMDLMNGIDFRKGCYVGQELTIRTKHRGVVRKRILPCVTYPPDQVPPRALTYVPSSPAPTAELIPPETSIGRAGKKGRSIGKWLSGVGNVGLALCRLEVMTDLVLAGEQTASAATPKDDFLMEWGEADEKRELKVLAFVPDWLRQGLSESPP